MKKQNKKEKEKEKEKALDYKQSHKLTMARYDYTPVEMRIFLSIIYLTDRYAHNGTYKDMIGEIEKGDYQQMVMKLPVKMLLGNEFEDGAVSRNHKCVRDPLRSFSQKPIAFYSEDMEEWRDTYPFVMTEISRCKEFVLVFVSQQMWRFLQGITGKYSTSVKDDISMPHSKSIVRLYNVEDGQMNPVTIKVETLKKALQDAKYNNREELLDFVFGSTK